MAKRREGLIPAVFYTTDGFRLDRLLLKKNSGLLGLGELNSSLI